VLWYGADVSFASAFAADSHDRDLLLRAIAFRLVAEQLNAPPDRAMLRPYQRLLTMIR
jgi:hypothetical protein